MKMVKMTVQEQEERRASMTKEEFAVVRAKEVTVALIGMAFFMVMVGIPCLVAIYIFFASF